MNDPNFLCTYERAGPHTRALQRVLQRLAPRSLPTIGADRALFALHLGEEGGGGLGAKLGTTMQEAIFLGETADD